MSPLSNSSPHVPVILSEKDKQELKSAMAKYTQLHYEISPYIEASNATIRHIAGNLDQSLAKKVPPMGMSPQ